MKLYAKKIHVILGLAVLTQMGCNGNQQRGQYLYPTVATQAQDLTQTGDAFRRSGNGFGGGASAANNWGNILGGMARGGGQTQMTQAELDALVQARLDAEMKAKEKEDGGTDKPETKREQTNFTVNRDDEMRASEHCSGPRNPDTDGDKISDACEVANIGQYPGIDSAVFNGFVVSATTFTKDQLIRQAKAKGINIDKGGDAEDSWFDRRMAKWYINLVNQYKANGIADQRAAQSILEGGTAAKPHPSMKAKDITAYTMLNEKFALVPGVGASAVPFGLESGSTNLANLSGIESTSVNIATEFAFVYGAMTNVIVPANLPSLEIAAATLVNQSEAVVGSKAGIFGVYGNGNTEIMISDLLATKDEGKSFRDAKGNLTPTSGCETVQMAIFFVADKKIENLENIFGQAVVYKDSEGVWRTFSQDMLSVKPRGSKCEYKAGDMMFNISELSKS